MIEDAHESTDVPIKTHFKVWSFTALPTQLKVTEGKLSIEPTSIFLGRYISINPNDMKVAPEHIKMSTQRNLEYMCYKVKMHRD